MRASDSTPIPRALNWLLGFDTAGVTKPQLFSCSDGQERVLKLPGLAPGSALAADWCGSLLAVELEIPTPPPSLVRIDGAALETMPRNRDVAKAGFGFGTNYISQAAPVTGIASIVGCSNHAAVLSRLAVLDCWIDIPDRMQPDPGRNLLISSGGGRTELVAIDFGMGFAGALYPLLGGGDPERDMHEPLVPEVRHLVDPRIAASAIRSVEETTEAEVIRMVSSCPDEWVDDETRGRMMRYLMSRQPLVRSCIEAWIDG
ncbi:MAG: HipA family kinase [Dehalococcoidia bacterium]